MLFGVNCYAAVTFVSLSGHNSDLTFSATRSGQEVAMSTGITGTDVLDLEISLAYVVLGGARGMWSRCPSGENARLVEEAAMSPTVTSIDQIDLDISVAYIALGAARHMFERCPSGENAKAVDDAEGAVDRLLDARLVAQS